MVLPAARIAEVINAQLPPLDEKLDTAAVASAVTEELESAYGADVVEAWTVEGLAFATWLPKHLTMLKRSRAAALGRRRKFADFRRAVETGQRPEPQLSAAMRRAMADAKARKSKSDGADA